MGRLRRLAFVHRSGAHAGLPLLIAVAAGCGDPISNAVFLEEALFLSALPTEARLEAPWVLTEGGSDSDNAVLAAARDSARDLDGVVAIPIAAGDALRATTPDVRSDVARTWDTPAQAVAMIDDAPLTFWVRGEILQPDDGDLLWSLDLAATEDGPWTLVAQGTHDAEGTSGTFTWDLPATVAELDLAAEDDIGPLEVDYVDTTETGEREVALTIGEGVQPFVWTVIGDTVLGFTSELEITEDGLPWLAQTAVAQLEEGGRAEGVLLKPEQVPFEACWAADGTTQWQSGEADVVAEGSADACSAPDIFDDGR